eukprot:SAG31_NODE_7304_length_1724_cov_1.875692_3_plen_47_part_00
MIMIMAPLEEGVRPQAKGFFLTRIYVRFGVAIGKLVGLVMVHSHQY